MAVVGLATLLCAILWVRPSSRMTELTQADASDPLALLFEDGALQHATETARSLFTLEPGAHFWEDLRDTLLPRFPDFPIQPGEGAHGQTTLNAKDGRAPEQAQIRWRGSLCWVSLQSPESRQSRRLDSQLQKELLNMRRMQDAAPDPAWQEDQSGNVLWYNKAYEALYQQVHGGPVNPQRALFGNFDEKQPNRVSLAIGANEPEDWYQLASVPVDDVTIFHATCINAVAEAEIAQRNFVQTLAKTFAHLSIGLAIFDRNGQLSIFNPALVDLTGLPAHFLSARPTMLSFFDQLRETRKMPEPKNYHNWREEIAGLIAAATDGRYQETWTLESGQTYNVKGRPHPDGATAFLIEDISAEMTLTRNFRAELEQGQLLLDTVDEAMVVFSPTGVLTFSNVAYRDMWSVDPDASFADVLISDCVKLWKERFGASRVWRSIEDFVSEFGERVAWDIAVGIVDDAPLRCFMVPLPSGATLVQFRKMPISTPVESERRRFVTG